MKTILQNVALPDIFRSKRFWVVALDLIFMVLVALEPRLADEAAQLKTAALSLGGFLLGGYIIQDTVIAVKQGVSKYQPAG